MGESERAAQEARLVAALEAEEWPVDLLQAFGGLAPTPGWIVAGCIAGLVWNRLTGRPPLTGIKDVDIAYFERDDLGGEREAMLAARLRAACPDLGLPLDVKNQAQVHLWYERKFGYPVPPRPSMAAAIATFPTTATAVGVTTGGGRACVIAPFGLDDLFAMAVRPNKAQITRQIYEAKIARWRTVWPELRVEPW